MITASTLAMGCVLDRSGTLEPEGGTPPPVDAGGGGFDAGDASAPPPVDAARPDGGHDAGVLPGDDAGPPPPPVDAGFDASLPDGGFDAGHDAGFDAGFDAGPPPPRTCGEIYGMLSGYSLCEETATTCRFYYATGSRSTCGNACASVGGSCIGSYDNGLTTCPGPPSTLSSCSDERRNQVCVCARVP